MFLWYLFFFLEKYETNLFLICCFSNVCVLKKVASGKKNSRYLKKICFRKSLSVRNYGKGAKFPDRGLLSPCTFSVPSFPRLSYPLHHFLLKRLFITFILLLSFKSGWPSGLRRCVQVAVYSCRRGFESHF